MGEHTPDTTDWISELPEFIIHHILSYLECQDIVRISVLSKRWFALTASFPILDFRLYKFRSALSTPRNRFKFIQHTRRRAREKFCAYVDYTISRFCQQNVRAHTFKLVTILKEPTDIDMVNRWIESVVEKFVQVLVFHINTERLRQYFSDKPHHMYCLPNKLLSASSLTSLTIHGCALPLSLIVDGVKFKWLKLLSLDRVPIDEEAMKSLTSGCPLLEEFTIVSCHGLKKLCLNGLQNLQKLWIDYSPGLERIDIEAPNLNYVSVGDFDGREIPCINMVSCKKLTTLNFYWDSSSISKWFAEFLSNFPIIENLFLNIPTQSNTLKVSSNSLRKFVLHTKFDLEGLEINTPSLGSFQYTVSSPDTLCRLPTTSAKVCMECNPWVDAEPFWFQKLRHFLYKTNTFKVLKLNVCTKFEDVDVLKAIQSPPCELEHVELKVVPFHTPSVFAAFVDALFWCCTPQSLTLISASPYIKIEVWSQVVKLAYMKLLQQVDHSQTNIQIVMSSAPKDEKHFNNLNSLLKALHHHQQQNHIITFTK